LKNNQAVSISNQELKDSNQELKAENEYLLLNCTQVLPCSICLMS